jgi:hypothetical protein
MPVQRLRLHHLHPEDEARATELLRALRGVYSAVVDGRGGWADVDFSDGCVSLDDMKAALREIGVEAKPAG